MKKFSRLETTSFFLHILAMAAMLCDHLWGTVISGNDWLTCFGRIAMPLYAFMLVEGCFYSHDRGRYARRILLCAVISEIPFNLMMGSRIFYPLHQNIIWGFLLGIALVACNERVKNRKLPLRILVGALTLLASVIGLIGFVDYYHYGILTILAFYFFRGRRWWQILGQVLALAYINLEMMGGLAYEWQLFGRSFFLPQQAFALLAFVPILLYRGKQGHHSPAFRWISYLFYPLHFAAIYLIKLIAF